MTSVHGIPVTGGSFPAQIWRLFMSSAIGQLEPVEFPEPKRLAGVDDVRARPVRALVRLLRDPTTTPSDDGRATTTATERRRPPRRRDRSDAEAEEAARRRSLRPRRPRRRDDPASAAGDDRRRRAGAEPIDRAPGRAALAAAGAVALLLAGCVACAWVERAPLVPADAGRADGGRLGVALPRAAGRRLRGLSRRAPAPAPRASPCGPRSCVAVVIQLLPLAAPLLLSTDAWTYWEYGRIAAVHDGNPYVDTPSEFPDDPAYEHAGAAWRETTSVYGPAFTLVSEGVALVSGSSAAAAAWIFKVLAALAVLACARAGCSARARPAFARAFVGWNPLLAIHFAGGGHNDALMMALVLGALALAAAGRRGLAGAAWVAPCSSSGCRSSSSACGRSRRARPAGASAIWASRAPRSAWPRSRRWRYGLDWLRAFGPLARNAEGQTSYALPHRARAARGSARRRARARGASCSRPGSPGWRARPCAAGPSRAGGLPAARDDALARALVRDLGAAARGGRRGPARAAARARVLRLPAAADDSALAPPEDEDAVLGEDAAPARVALERGERALAHGRAEAVEIGQPACVDRHPLSPPRGPGS